MIEELEAAAHNYHALGLSVIPFRITKNGNEYNKIILSTGWKKWEAEKQTDEEFLSLDWSGSNAFAVILGNQANNGLYLSVIDYDCKGNEVKEEVKEIGRTLLKEFPITCMEQTVNNGLHLVFWSRTKPKTIGSYHNTASLELLGEKKLCLMAPSLGYSKLNDNAPTETVDIEQIFLSVMKKHGLLKEQKKTQQIGNRKPTFSKPRPCILEALKLQLTGPNGHLMRLAIAAEYKRLGLNDQEIINLFRTQSDFDFETCKTQVASANLEKTAKCKSIAELGYCLPECQHEAAYGFDFFCDEDGHFVPAKLAEWIMSKYTFVTMMDNQETFVYEDGFYQQVGDVLVKKLTKDALGEEYRKNRATEVLDYIKAGTYVIRREEPANLLPLENGVLDLSKEPFELKPHSPTHIFFNKLPVKYDAKADCPNISKFLKEITNCQEDETLLTEVIGYSLYREYFISKALMLVGEGSNGKSTFLNLVKALLGLVNVSGRSLQDLELNRFAKADLYTKLANIYADLPDRALQSTGTFKMLTGRDLIAAEKKFSQPFHFVNYAKLMFSANKVPEANDDTSAFFRRWIIIVFPKVFKPGSNDDPHIIEKLTTESELSGLLNLALAALERLLKCGRFSSSKTTEEIKEDYIRKSSPIAAFLMDCTEADSDAFIEKKALYSTFAEYCRNLKLPIVTQDTFFKNLPQHAAIAEYRPTLEGKRFTAFKGIRYRADVSTLSTLSRVFYHLNENSEQFKKNYKVTAMPETDFVKIEITPDTIDTLDAEKQQTLSIQTPVKPSEQHDETIEDTGYHQLVCYFCGKALMDNDWEQSGFSENKPAHRKCCDERRSQLKKPIEICDFEEKCQPPDDKEAS